MPSSWITWIHSLQCDVRRSCICHNKSYATRIKGIVNFEMSMLKGWLLSCSICALCMHHTNPYSAWQLLLALVLTVCKRSLSEIISQFYEWQLTKTYTSANTHTQSHFNWLPAIRYCIETFQWIRWRLHFSPLLWHNRSHHENVHTLNANSPLSKPRFKFCICMNSEWCSANSCIFVFNQILSVIGEWIRRR